MLLQIHEAGLPTRAVKRLERYAVELAHAGPAVQSANLARRALAPAAELFDIFDVADPDVSTAALGERVASLEGRLSVLEARLLADDMSVETGLTADLVSRTGSE